jgi:pyruvate formate lyase activating enzyme
MSFGMLGCDFHCGYCQNWVTSQALRDPNAISPPHRLNAQQFAAIALEQGARIVTSTYNEPLITSEWAVEVFKEARKAGLKTSYVSNGNGTPEVLEYIRPWVDLYKVDLKSFQDRSYRKLGGLLSNVLETIQRLYTMGFWLEIVTLVIPGFNDTAEELRDMAQFLVRVSPDIPWHVTAFHQDYKMTGPDNTSAGTLLRAAEIGKAEGLHFVYAGNLPGRVNVWENTYCPGCSELLVERIGYRIRAMRIRNGACPKCSRPIPGVWN